MMCERLASEEHDKESARGILSLTRGGTKSTQWKSESKQQDNLNHWNENNTKSGVPSCAAYFLPLPFFFFFRETRHH